MRTSEEALKKLDELTDYIIRLDMGSIIRDRIFGQIEILEWVLKDEIHARLERINEQIRLVSINSSDKKEVKEC